MRILKYFFLIILLTVFAAAVFIATQRGDYDVSRSVVVPLSKDVAFRFVNDYNNWETWYADRSAERKYSVVTAGKGAKMSWETALSEGSVQTISTKDTDSIYQVINNDGLPAEAKWLFKDTVGGTKVTLRIKGKMGFMPKVYATLQGGPSKVIGSEYDRSLAAMKKSAIKEIGKYKINIDGLVSKPGNYFLRQTIISTIEKMPRNIEIMMSKMIRFFTKNKIRMAGKPFVLYDYVDTQKGLAKFSVCVPVREEISIAPGSDISAGKLDGMLAIKTSLFGDYSHLKEAWDKSFAYIKENKYDEGSTGYVEVYKISKSDVKRPSKWVTEIYIPVADKAPAPVVAPRPTPVKPLPQDPETEAPSGEISIP